MSKIKISISDIKKLEENPHVKHVSNLSITYTDEFKQIFMEAYLSGKLPRLIFYENGFDIEVIGIKRIEQCAARWKKLYRRDGIIGLIGKLIGIDILNLEEQINLLTPPI